MDLARRPPIVLDIDRAWALAQKPVDWEQKAPDLDFELHVAEQIERFEVHFADDRKPHAEWSGLWRRVWWPKADPSILHPDKVDGPAPVMVRRGDAHWSAAMTVLSRSEKALAEQLGVVPFKPNDPRLEHVLRAP